MKTTKVIKSFDKDVMYGFSKYNGEDGNPEGIILFRFEEDSLLEDEPVFYTEQKIHIDNKVLETVKGWINEQRL